MIWDVLDSRSFVVSDGTGLHTYLCTPAGAAGAGVQLLCRTALPATHVPVVVANGAVTCRLKSGALDKLVVESHRALQAGFEAVVGGGGGGASVAKGMLTKR